MKTRFSLRWLAGAWMSCLLVQELSAATPAFTYQGRLSDGGLPANGSYDIKFTLFDASAGGTQVGEAVAAENQSVALGQFQIELDFGAGVFLGEDRWMEIAVRPAESTGEYAILNPRQRISPAPYAMFALDGNPGPMGPAGPPGLQGETGLTGPVGAVGPPGPQGLQGTQGAIGPLGPAGPQGEHGETGPAGISISWLGSLADAPGNAIINQAYHNASDGVAYVFDGVAWQILARDGAVGPQGLKGETGATGLTGPLGAQGPQGESGPQGTQGPIGPIGPEGPPSSLDAWALTGSVGTDPLLNFLGTADAQPLEVRVNNHLALRIQDDPSGPLVGVNTNAPQATLHVNGNTLIEGNISVLGAFNLQTTSFPQLAINTDIPKPGYELSVDGQIVCEELLVQDSADWPDYVFAESYLLRSLEEVESYIKSQRRLPGIPSAAEVDREGISIGVMQKRMMEKIEELTLYSIEQNKRLAQQESRIRALEERLTQTAKP